MTAPSAGREYRGFTRGYLCTLTQGLRTEGDQDPTLINQTAELILTKEGSKTRMVLKASVTAAGPRAGFAVSGMEYGYNQQFDKLATLLTK